MTINQNQRK